MKTAGYLRLSAMVTELSQHHYMRSVHFFCILVLTLLTACSTGRAPTPSRSQNLQASPTGMFVYPIGEQPLIKLLINPDGSYFAQQRPGAEFWPMIEGNKLYPQRVKPESEKGQWSWDPSTGVLTLTAETAPAFRWPIDHLKYHPARPNRLDWANGEYLIRVGLRDL